MGGYSLSHFQSRFQSRYRGNLIWGVDEPGNVQKWKRWGLGADRLDHLLLQYTYMQASTFLIQSSIEGCRQSVRSKMAASIRSQDVREKVVKEGMLRHRQSSLYSRVSPATSGRDF